jgi:hypothetical protein
MTATSAGLAEPVIGAAACVFTGETQPRARTPIAPTMNREVIMANTSLPRCPYQVRAATSTSRISTTGIRTGPREGT